VLLLPHGDVAARSATGGSRCVVGVAMAETMSIFF
jgi:hypothetical protein